MSGRKINRGLIVGQVIQTQPHPRGDYIRLAIVDFGDDKQQQIVYGGRRTLQNGDLVPVAPPGSRLHTGVKMRRRRYRGEWSHGMLCSTEEMGWDTSGPNEVAVLQPGIAPPGTSLDSVHRPDEWLDEESNLRRKHHQTNTDLRNESAQAAADGSKSRCWMRT
jgi:tRNA-binding EMAP/Myf-like protein